MDISSQGSEHIGKQEAVFARALEIHNQHSGNRDIFRQSGWRGALVDMHKKFDRVWGRFWGQDIVHGASSSEDDLNKLLDDAYDLLNYTGFFIQQVLDNNPDGEWNWNNE